MLIGQIDNRSLGLGGQQPIENHYVSDITVTLLKWRSAVTDTCTQTHTAAPTHTDLHLDSVLLSGGIHLRGSPQKAV